MALEHPKIVAEDFFRYSSYLPLRSIDRVEPWEVLGAGISTPVEDGSFETITDALGTRILLQSLNGNTNAFVLTADANAEHGVAFDFELTPTLLPPPSSTELLTFTLQTKAYVAVLFFTDLCVYYGDLLGPASSVQNSGEIVAERRRYRLFVDDDTGDAAMYAYIDGSWTLMQEWTAQANVAASAASVTCVGTLTAPTAMFLWDLRMFNVSVAPQDPTADIAGTMNTSAGLITTLDGSGSIDPLGGALDLVWFLTAPEGSDTTITEESTSTVALTTIGLDVITFMLPGLGIDGDLYVLDIGTWIGTTKSITLDDRVITIRYPAGTTFDALQVALLIASDAAYNPAVSAIMTAASVGAANDLPVAEVSRFDGGRASTADTVALTPDITGVYVVGLGARSATGIWDVDTFALAASPLNVVFGSAPDVGFIRRQVSGWWKSIENRKQIEAAWGGSAQIAASDLLDILQTRMTRIFDRIPEFWRKRWYDLKMQYSFNAVSTVTATQHTEYALRGVATPVDDYDQDATGMSMTPVAVTYNQPVTMYGSGDTRYLELPGVVSWTDLPNVVLGATAVVGGTTMRVTAIANTLVTATVLVNGGVIGVFATITVTGVASGNVSGRTREFLANITTSLITSLACPQDVIPTRDLVDAGSSYGFVFAANTIHLSHGQFSADAIAGDWFIAGGVPHLITAVTANSVTLTDLPFTTPTLPTGFFTWSIYRPVAPIIWEAMGYVDVPDQDTDFCAGDMLLLHARGLEQVDKVYATVRYIDQSRDRYYFSLNDLYNGLLLTRSAWGELELTCSGIERGNNIPLSEYTHFVPVIRTTLLVDSLALIVNEDYTVVNGTVVLAEGYDVLNTPPPSLWAENMLLYNWYASETWGALVGVTLDEVVDPEVYVPLVRSIYDQRMYGPWKFMMERAAAALIGLPFAIDEGTVASSGDGWLGIQGLNKLRMYHTDYPADLRVYDTDLDEYTEVQYAAQFQALDTRLRIVDRVDDSSLFNTYKAIQMAVGHADWWHDFLVSVKHTAAPGAPWSELLDYIRESKPIWTDFKIAVQFNFEAQVEVNDELTLRVKHFFFDVPTACVYPDCPLVKGSAHMFDDPVWGLDGVDYSFTADGGSNVAVTLAAADFAAEGVRRGCVVLNETKEAYGWVTHVTVGTIHIEYGMKNEAGDDTVTNVATNKMHVVDGGFRWGFPFDIPLRNVSGALTLPTRIEFTPWATSVDYKGNVVTKDLEFFGVDRGWTVRNRTVAPGVPPYPESSVRDVDTVTNVARLETAIGGQAPGNIIEWEPPTGVGVHIFGDPEIRGPMAHPYLKRSSFVAGVTNAYIHLSKAALFDETRPMLYGYIANPLPIVTKMTPLTGAPLDTVTVIGHYFLGVAAVGSVSLGGILVVPVHTGDWKFTFVVPGLGPGSHDLVVTDPNGPTTYEYPFVIP